MRKLLSFFVFLVFLAGCSDEGSSTNPNPVDNIPEEEPNTEDIEAEVRDEDE